MNKQNYAMTLVELIVVLFLFTIILAAMIPMLTKARRSASSMQNNIQLRGIHQALVMFANTNNKHYPGLDAAGEIIQPTVEARYQILLEAGYFTGEYAISPVDVKTEWTLGTVTSVNYSFAMLDIDLPKTVGRYLEWHPTNNIQAPILTDRYLGLNSIDRIYSLYTDKTSNQWKGAVTYNDNHIVFEKNHILKTKFGSAAPNLADNLFTADTPNHDDAYMIYEGK